MFDSHPRAEAHCRVEGEFLQENQTTTRQCVLKEAPWPSKGNRGSGPQELSG